MPWIFIITCLMLPHDVSKRAQSENRLNTFDRRVGLPGLRLHPLFAWASAPQTPGYNNHGFLSDHDYPYRPRGNEFVVGVLGGSVAVNFWLRNRETGLFQKHIRNFVPELADRNIVLLNLSKEAYRQPQQLAVLQQLTLSGQKFNLLINIEGYNEITSGWANRTLGVDLSFPSANLLFEFARLTRSDGLGVSSAHMLTKRDIQTRAFEQDLATAWLGLMALSKLVELSGKESAATDDNAYSSAGNLLLIPLGKANEDQAAFLDEFTQYWQTASALTRLVAEASGAIYLQVLQPNQYVETKRHFTVDELENAFVDGNAYDGLVNSAYIRIREALKRIEFPESYVDASFALDGIRETVYADNCCHMNNLGRDALSRFIARSAAARVQSRLGAPTEP